MANQFITYLGDARPLPMRSPEIESYKYRELGEIVQQNAKALGGSLDQYAEFERQKGQIQDIKNFLDSDSQIDSIVGEFKVKQAQNPLAYDKHKQWAGEAMKKIGGLKYTFSDELNATKFEAKKKGIITDFNIKTAIGIGESELTDAKNIWQSNYGRQIKEGRYGDAKATLAAGAGVFENPTIIENEIAGVDHTETLNIAGNDILKDPNDALKKLQGGHYKGLREDEVYNLKAEASKVLNKKRVETGESLLGRQFLGTVVTDDEIDDYYKKGYVNLSQAIRIKENNKARIKNTPPVYNDETYGMLDGLITDYNPEADSNGDKAAYVTNEIAASDLPDAYKKKLQERFKDKGDAVNDSEKRRVSGMQDFARKEVDRLMNSGVFGDYKGNDLKLLTGEGNFDLDASYKKSPGYEEAILKASKITQDVDEFIRSNPSAGQEQIKEYIKTRSDEMKPSKTIDISTKKAPVSFTGSMPTSIGLTPKESGAALRDAMNSMDMNIPRSKAPSMMDIIVSQEARRDDNGNLMVYNLPAEDGGGSYEVAGINEKHNPKMAAELANYVRTGNHKEAEKKTREYTEELTRRPAELMKEAGIKSAPVETFLRDSFHNMGEGGMARVIQRATGSPASGKMDDATVKALGNLVKDNGNVGAISALNKARQEHYLAIVKSKPEKEIFKDGWLDRSNRVAGLALNVADYDFKGTDWATVRSGLITEGAKMKMSYRQILAAVGQARQNWLVSNSPFNL